MRIPLDQVLCGSLPRPQTCFKVKLQALLFEEAPLLYRHREQIHEESLYYSKKGSAMDRLWGGASQAQGANCEKGSEEVHRLKGYKEVCGAGTY